jgi:hypothetical protein
VHGFGLHKSSKVNFSGFSVHKQTLHQAVHDNLCLFEIVVDTEETQRRKTRVALQELEAVLSYQDVSSQFSIT